MADARPVRNRSHSLALGASYEIDLWGRLRSGAAAARLESDASRQDLETMAMSLSARVTQTWFDLIAQGAQLRLAGAQLESSRTQLDLVELRFARGLASALEVYQQRQQYAALKAQVPLLENRITTATHQLNLLLGRNPATPSGEVPDELPGLAPLPAIGLPADLLSARPDVRAAGLRIAAADRRVAVALAERFPRLTLSASRGYGAGSFADLFDRMLWSVAGSLTASLYDGHVKNREVARSRAVVAERLAAYGQVVLTALAEVEGALAGENNQSRHVALLGEQLALSRATLNEARRQYINGLGDYLAVLAALNALQQTERELITARFNLVNNRIQLCRSLGGSWTAQLSRQNQTGDPQ